MLDGFDLPLTYLFFFFIPMVFITLALLVRSFMERSLKGNLGRTLFWSVTAGLLGLLTCFIIIPSLESRSIHIYYYGIMITTGVLAAAFLSQAEAKRRALDPEIIWDVLFWVVLAGIIGARLWHILLPTKELVEEQQITTLYYLTHPLEMLNVRKGGLGIPGAVIGGALALFIYCRGKKLSFLTWADIAAPGVALAQAIGRWGNYFNQELYGSPTNLPWGISIDPIHRLPGYEEFMKFHPLFFYESLWNVANMALLLCLARRFPKSLKPGDIFIVYILFYSAGRFFLDFLRLDIAVIGGVNANQVIMGVLGIFAAGVLFWRHRRVRS